MSIANSKISFLNKSSIPQGAHGDFQKEPGLKKWKPFDEGPQTDFSGETCIAYISTQLTGKGM